MTTPKEKRTELLIDPAFREGYLSTWAWSEGYAMEPPKNGFAIGTAEFDMWALGAEQADLEGGSPDSWADGGAGMRGVLRLVPPQCGISYYGDHELHRMLRERYVHP